MTQFINFDVGKSYNRRIEASIVSVGCGRYSSHGAPYRSSFFTKWRKPWDLPAKW
jgi:hypothetical protein